MPDGLGGLLIESVLQDLVWDAGWVLLSALAAQSGPSARHASPSLAFAFEETVTDGTLEVRPALTVMARSRLALVSAGSRDMRSAQRFVRFMSGAAQSSSPPADGTRGSPRLSPPSHVQYLSIDMAQMERREPVVSALSRQWLAAHSETLRQSCEALREAARRGPRGDYSLARTLAEARSLAYGAALPERILGDDAVSFAFNPQIREVLRRPRVSALEAQRSAATLERRAQAITLLNQARLTR